MQNLKKIPVVRHGAAGILLGAAGPPLRDVISAPIPAAVHICGGGKAKLLGSQPAMDGHASYGAASLADLINVHHLGHTVLPCC